MKNSLKALLGTALIAGAMLAQSAQAEATLQEVVHDARDNVVTSRAFGNCVRTKWEAESDECAPQAQAVSRDHQRGYLVFFDFDRFSLTQDARDVLNNLYSQVKGAKVVRFDVTGHADRSGSDAYNMQLSKNRAQAVVNELRRMGVNAQNIRMQWKGERDPLVSTPDGIREAQNRRAEIKVHVETMETK